MNMNSSVLEMIIDSLEVGPIDHEGFYPVTIKTSRGILECRYYAAAERRRGVIFVGGEDGGWDTPVRNMLYPTLSHHLARHKINCLRIKYRKPKDLTESTLDLLAGVAFLTQDGVESIGVVGHSFGAAVAIQGAAASPFISTVVSLSPQTLGTDAVESFRETQSLLLMHGTAGVGGEHQPISSIYEYAHDPKKIMIFRGANQNLDEAAPEVFTTIKEWLQVRV
jgi:alpha/beta superfamily hydrolase